MKQFYQEVDRDNRAAMIQYLENHFRYNTLNSWNRSTSYANCMKVHRLDLPGEIMDKAFEMLDCSEIYDVFNRLLRDWADAHDWEWQAGFNGRSGGYLVLYRGGLDWKNARTAKCDHCGKLTWHKRRRRAHPITAMECCRYWKNRCRRYSVSRENQLIRMKTSARGTLNHYRNG